MLLAALLGPYFVDWTAYRTSIEAEASRLAGTRVRILGGVDLKLLPTPSMRLAEVRVGDGDEPLATAVSVAAEVDLPALLSGEVRVLALTIDRPTIHLAVGADGRLAGVDALGSPAFDPDKVSLDDVTVVDGTLLVAPAGAAPRRVNDIDLTLAARSLAGPYRAEGSGRFGDLRAEIHVGTGTPDETGAVRVKLDLAPEALPLAITADGLASLADGAPRFAGTMTASRRPAEEGDAVDATAPAEPVRLESTFVLSPTSLALTEASFAYGPAERPVALTGAATVTLAPELAFEADLAARQLDLDRLVGAETGGRSTPAEALAAAVQALAGVPTPTIPGRIRLEAPSVVVGGAVLQGALVEASAASTGWHLRTLSVAAPGRSTFSLSGDFVGGSEPRFDGSVALSSDQPAALAAWWRATDTVPAAAEPVTLEAGVSASADAVLLPTLRISSGGTTLSGDFGWRAASDGVAASVEVSLSGPVVDVDALSALGRLVGGGASAVETLSGNVAVRLSGDRIRVGDIEGGGFDLAATLADGSLDVERMVLADLAGARLEASGRIDDLAGAPTGDLTAKLQASRLDGLAALVVGVAPGSSLARQFAVAAPSLAPADLSLALTARPEGEGVSADLTLAGTAGGSRLDGTLGFVGRPADWAAGRIDAALKAEGPDAGRLIAQLGVPVLPVALGAGSLEVTASGVPRTGLDARFSADVAGTRLGFEGRVAVPAGQPVETSGTARLESPDVSEIALAAGHLLPILDGGVPVDLELAFEGLGKGLAVRRVSGDVAGVGVTGAGALDLSGSEPRLTGTLSLTEVDLTAIGELAFGPGAFSGDEAGWPRRAFSPSAIAGMEVDLEVAAERLWLGAFGVEAARFGLASAGGELRLDDVAGSLAGGRFTAAMTARVIDGDGSLDARVGLVGGQAEEIVWAPDGRPVASGTLDFSAEGKATGRSAAALAASLAGSGSFDLRDAAIRGFDPAAFAATIRAADAGMALDEANLARVFVPALDAGTLPVARAAGTIAIIAGRARVANVAVETAAADVRGDLTIDLTERALVSDWSIAVEPGADGVAGTIPSAAISFAGPIAAPQRSVDATPLLAFLSLRASDREAKRLEALEAELAEQRRRAEEARRRIEEERRAREAEAVRLEAFEAVKAAEETRRIEAERLRQAEEEARIRAAEADRARAEEEARRILGVQPGADLAPLPPAVVIERPPGAVPPGPAPMDLSPAP